MSDYDKRTYHAKHNDPAADLVLECKDGVKFRVHSYLLKAHSEYFRDIPPHTDGIVGNGSKVIHLDCPSKDLALLLGLINKSRTQAHMSDLARHPASHCITYDNADIVFKFASSHRFFDLAKIAIAKFFCMYKHADYTQIGPSICDDIPGRYAAALIIAVASNPRVANEDDELRWGRISAAFDIISEDDTDY